MYVCEDKEQSKALLHFYTINTFCLERESNTPRLPMTTCIQCKTHKHIVTQTRGISERGWNVYIPARKLKYLHVCLNVIKYNASRVLSSWEWAASG